MKDVKNNILEEAICRIAGGIIYSIVTQLTVNYNITIDPRPILPAVLYIISPQAGKYSNCVRVIGETILVNFANDIVITYFNNYNNQNYKIYFQSAKVIKVIDDDQKRTNEK